MCLLRFHMRSGQFHWVVICKSCIWQNSRRSHSRNGQEKSSIDLHTERRPLDKQIRRDKEVDWRQNNEQLCSRGGVDKIKEFKAQVDRSSGGWFQWSSDHSCSSAVCQQARTIWIMIMVLFITLSIIIKLFCIFRCLEPHSALACLNLLISRKISMPNSCPIPLVALSPSGHRTSSPKCPRHQRQLMNLLKPVSTTQYSHHHTHKQLAHHESDCIWRWSAS